MHLWQQQQQQEEKQLELVALLSFPYLSWHLLKLHWNWEDNADCSLSVSFFSENEHLHVSAVLVAAVVVVAFSPTLFVYFSVCFSCEYVVWRTCRPSECSYAAITSSMLTHRQTHSHTHTYVYKRGGERERERDTDTHWRTPVKCTQRQQQNPLLMPQLLVFHFHIVPVCVYVCSLLFSLMLLCHVLIKMFEILIGFCASMCVCVRSVANCLQLVYGALLPYFTGAYSRSSFN